MHGSFLIRIEDLDQSRARDHWEAQIYADLAWLNLTWETPVLRQSTRAKAYHSALQRLWDQDLIYPCTCTRRDIADAVSAPHFGPDGQVYPGTCRHKPKPKTMPTDTALRLDMAKAHRRDLDYTRVDDCGIEIGTVTVSPGHTVPNVGDPVVSRRGMEAAYHLAVVVDDAFQIITHVVRGEDLEPATAIHTVLQDVLGLRPPKYHHHRVITDERGKRLAKRDDARAIAAYRDDGLSPSDVLMLVGLQK